MKITSGMKFFLVTDYVYQYFGDPKNKIRVFCSKRLTNLSIDVCRA